MTMGQQPNCCGTANPTFSSGAFAASLRSFLFYLSLMAILHSASGRTLPSVSLPPEPPALGYLSSSPSPTCRTLDAALQRRGSRRSVASPSQPNTEARGRSGRTQVLFADPNDDSPAVLSRRYCADLRHTRRFPARTVYVGNVPMGAEHPIRCQTMTTSDTRDVEASVAQVIRCAKAGADLVRLTVQGVKEAAACHGIRESLFSKGYDIPLVADIHFNPKIALLAADSFEKIRINPGNFAHGVKKWDDEKYESEKEFAEGTQRIEELFTPIVEKCKALKRAIRIGTNHGSLSARILGYYGDTAKGMVESAFEFAEICRKNNFHNFVFSMKSSNPVVMVQAYRRLAAEQIRRGWNYPIHLGVTEAGQGEDGRVKSSLGIGALLQDGIGDTIRVSLTEDAWLELGPCRKLAELAERKCQSTAQQDAVPDFAETTRDITSFSRREVELPKKQPGDTWDVDGVLHRDGSVILPLSLEDLRAPNALYEALGCKQAVGVPLKDHGTVDSIFLEKSPDDAQSKLTIQRLQDAGVGLLVAAEELQRRPLKNVVAVSKLRSLRQQMAETSTRQLLAIELEGDETEEELAKLNTMKPSPSFLIFNPSANLSFVHSGRRIFDWLKRANSKLPVILRVNADGNSRTSAEDLSIAFPMDIGSLLMDGLGNGVFLGGGNLSPEQRRSMSFNILQGSRMRSTKTEYISCPSCGRTLFNLQDVTDQIRRRTGHLPGVAIAVMGCIVNGVGEMADADFGYVGGAPGKVDLYVKKTVVQRGIPNEEACDKLIDLIKAHGRWIDPPEEASVPRKEEESVVTSNSAQPS